MITRDLRKKSTPPRSATGRRIALATCAAALAGAGLAAERAGPIGYLPPGGFDVMAVLPPAPREGDARAEADRAIFRVTRKLADTPRWAMATNDVRLSPTDMMRDFSCAAGATLTPETAPATLALVTRAAVDTSRQSSIAKDAYKRRRPFLIDEGRTCQPAAQLRSFDYPSGHTTLGWTWATLLAWAVPERATAILTRGRAYGESRIVCGVHNASAVEAGRLSATATFDAIAGDPAFQRDLAAARDELARLRSATPPPAASCTAEAALVAERIY